jgi:hypothetical protein
MNNFKNYLQESSIKPAKLSSGRFAIGNQFRLMRDVDGLQKGNEYTLIPIDEECDLIVLGGIGEYSFKDQKTNKKYCIHAGPRIIDELFELIPLADPSPSLSESKEPQAAQAYPVSERVIERIIVEGDKGERGERGLQGLIGPVGPAGPKGERGDKGDKGDVGERGERGEPGAIGARGETGAKGDRGERGEQGPQGLQGIEGKQGPAGLNGDIGPVGPQGLQGLQGEKGEKGERGEKGEQGPQGLQGEIGPSGPAGANGAPGPIGLKGEKGDKGDTGPRGEKGDTGDIGIATAVYPLKLDDKTLSVEQTFFQELIGKASDGFTAQSGGGGNVDIFVDGEKAVKNLRSINFKDGFIVTKERGNKVSIAVDQTNLGYNTGKVLYFNYSQNSDISPYKVLSENLTTASEQSLTQLLDTYNSNGYQTTSVTNFITAIGSPNQTVIDPGVFDVTLYANVDVDTGGRECYLFTRLYKRASDGTETQIAQSDNSKKLTTSLTDYSFEIIIPLPVAIDATDRLLLEIYAVHRGNSHNIISKFEGSSHYAHMHTTLRFGATAGVSSLNGLNGALSITAGNNIVVTPSGSNIEVGLASSLDGGSF